MDTMATHPYYPQDVILSGKVFTENNLALTTLLMVFATGLAVILGSVLLLIRGLKPKLCIIDIGLILWFSMCG